MNPIIFQDQSGLAQGIAGAGTALAQALAQRGQQYGQKIEEQQKQQKYQTILGQTLGNLNQDSGPIEILKALNQLAGKVPPELLKNISSYYQPFIKEKIKSEEQQSLFSKLGLIDSDLGNRPSPNYNYPQIERTTSTEIGGDIPTRKGIKSWDDTKLLTFNAAAEASGNKTALAISNAEIKERELDQKKEDSLWNYKPTQDFITRVEETAKDAEFANQVADEVINLMDTAKDVDPTSVRTFLTSIYGENAPWLFTPETASLKYLEKLQAKGLKDIFSRPTEKEFFFINAAQAQLGKSREANKAIANLQKRFNSIPIRIAEIKDEIIQQNNGVPPRDLAAKVRKRAKQEQELVINQSAKLVYDFGDDKQKQEAYDYLKDKDSTIKKPLTEEIKIEILKEANMDPNKALQIAKRRGYEIK